MVEALFRKAQAGLTYASSGPEGLKRLHELRVWKARLDNGGWLQSDRYKYLYTDFFEIDESFYSGKRILDIGCGPGGSLEWADMASVRVGLDPFALDYRREFNTDNHKMQYVSARAEEIPFPDESFDIVSSFMSLKHVIGIEKAIKEISRVVSRRGMFFLHTPINSRANHREPSTITWDVIDKICQHMRLSQGHYGARQAWPPKDYRQWVPDDPQIDGSRLVILKAIFIKE